MELVALCQDVTEPDDYDLVVVDLGYSASKKSCGVAAPEREPCNMKFACAVEFVGQQVRAASTNPLVVLEGPLSCCHNTEGNPKRRGEFEKGRGWYYGAGAVTALAARRLLSALKELEPCEKIYVAEAFLSNKDRPTNHAEDAENILVNFWDTPPEELVCDCTPLSPMLSDVPPVRVF